MKPSAMWTIAAVGLLLLVSGISADASEITIAGGFTGYTGDILCGTSQTFVAGTDLCLDSSAFAFGPTLSVDFYRVDSGVQRELNNLSFTPAAPQEVANLGDEFLLGTLSFTNGIWAQVGSDPAEFSFSFTTDSTDPLFDDHTWTESFTLILTPAGGTPEENADFIYLTDHPELGSVRVYESFDGSNVGTVAVYGRIGSLIPTGFANPQGGAFLSSSIDLDPTPVPEPATLVLLGSGLAGIAGHVRRHGRKRARRANLQ